jgi:hypothetical protein
MADVAGFPSLAIRWKYPAFIVSERQFPPLEYC